jgi:hypothetical protein
MIAVGVTGAGRTEYRSAWLCYQHLRTAHHTYDRRSFLFPAPTQYSGQPRPSRAAAVTPAFKETSFDA